MTALQEKIETELLENLNEVQQQAVLHGEGPLLILAGAGSGKTRVITHRIAHLCRVRSVRPDRIAAVTFTNKAAQEMRNRLANLIGPMAGDVHVRTFHALGLYVLRRNAAHLKLKSNFSVLDPDACSLILKKILKDKKIDPSMMSADAAANLISKARDSLVSPEEMSRRQDHFSQMTAPIYREYLEILRKNNSVDFGDLLYLTVELFQNSREVLDFYQNYWKYFLIDEYQDTNRAQYMLGRLIAAKHGNIAVVGDDDQSIYSWRGADITNILEFEKDYPSCSVLRLEQNYRSTGKILKAASSIIKNNSGRREKTLYTEQGEGENADYTLYDTESEEATGTVEKILRLKNEGVSLRNVAIFYRTNAQSRVFEEALRSRGVPFVMVGGFRFYDRKEIKDLSAYLSVIVNPLDSVSLERIINVPARGIGEGALSRLQQLAFSKNITLLDVLEYAGELPGIRGAAKIKALHTLFQEWTLLSSSDELPSLIASRVMEQSGYLENLKKDPSPEAASRIENLYEFVGSIQEYEERCAASGEKADLAGYLQMISLYTSENSPENQETLKSDPLFLMTLHNAKGLEFEFVFLTGLEEGFIPHSLAVEEGGLEEERRLMYVGITRAMKKLHFSSCRYRRIFGSFQPRSPSRFLSEIDADVFSSINQKSAVTVPRADAGVRQKEYTEENFKTGDRISHQKYGTGRIVETVPTPAGQKVSIQFDGDERIRFFLTKYTPLKLC